MTFNYWKGINVVMKMFHSVIQVSLALVYQFVHPV